MIKRLVLAAALTLTAIAAAPVPRPAGELPFEVAGKGQDLLSRYKGKVVLLVAILTS